jgi:lipopolysaccharide export system protein LptA
MLRKTIVISLLALFFGLGANAQKLIEYQSGMGARRADNPDVWILYKTVKATHEGMVLNSDSAHYDTKKNNFTAFGNIVIEISDTTTIFGDELFYNGNTRVVEIWGDEVLLVDGATSLTTTYISYNRKTETAKYTYHGHAVNGDKTLDSYNGLYYADKNEFFIYDDVMLTDSTTVLTSDTMTYNTNTKLAVFHGPTHIFTNDSTIIYSENGTYNTDDRHATSVKKSTIYNGNQRLTCDTLDYYRSTKFGIAKHNVNIWDSANNIFCTGHYGETDGQNHYNYLTDSATAHFVNDKNDTLFMHSDTVYSTINDDNEIQTVSAYHKVRLFRSDVQGQCDSAFYNIADSLLTLYYTPIAWYDSSQCTADTIVMKMDTNGVKNVYLNGNAFVSQKVAETQYNQVKGKKGVVYFTEGEPTYADVLGNAQSVYYLTEDKADKTQELMGVNVGVGSDMRIYIRNRKPYRVATYTNPDMKAYPPLSLPQSEKFIKGFQWYGDIRPRTKADIYTWTTPETTNKESQK